MPARLTRCGVPHPAGASLALAGPAPASSEAATAVATTAARIFVVMVISEAFRSGDRRAGRRGDELPRVPLGVVSVLVPRDVVAGSVRLVLGEVVGAALPG